MSEMGQRDGTWKILVQTSHGSVIRGPDVRNGVNIGHRGSVALPSFLRTITSGASICESSVIPISLLRSKERC
jgi:hypothetical protein